MKLRRGSRVHLLDQHQVEQRGLVVGATRAGDMDTSREAVSAAHEAADELEASLRAVLADPTVTVRAMPAWSPDGMGAPTVSVEIGVRKAGELAASLRRIMAAAAACGHQQPAEHAALAPSDDWLASWRR